MYRQLALLSVHALDIFFKLVSQELTERGNNTLPVFISRAHLPFDKLIFVSILVLSSVLGHDNDLLWYKIHLIYLLNITNNSRRLPMKMSLFAEECPSRFCQTQSNTHCWVVFWLWYLVVMTNWEVAHTYIFLHHKASSNCKMYK